MHRVAIISALLLTGCAASKTTYLPDGTKGQSINCSGPYLNWGACYEKAGQLCKTRGYEIVHREGDVNESATATRDVSIAGANVQRTLVIKCKPEAAAR